MPKAEFPIVLVGYEDPLDEAAFQKLMMEISQAQADDLGITLSLQLCERKGAPGKIGAAIFNVHGTIADAKRIMKCIQATNALSAKIYPAGYVLPASFQKRPSGPLN